MTASALGGETGPRDDCNELRQLTVASFASAVEPNSGEAIGKSYVEASLDRGLGDRAQWWVIFRSIRNQMRENHAAIFGLGLSG